MTILRGKSILRSAEHPDGCPGLSGRERHLVEQENTIYHYMVRTIHMLSEEGILWSVESPASRFIWQTSWLKWLEHAKQAGAAFDAYMHGGATAKRVTIRHHQSLRFAAPVVESPIIRPGRTTLTVMPFRPASQTSCSDSHLDRA